jgi:two-component system, chemotaxis family, CheB/CheR fusion protein
MIEGRIMTKGDKKGKMEKGIVSGENNHPIDVPFPIVALGSSAGGLEAIEAFFKTVPPDSGLAYIVVTHLEPHHRSMMAEIISKTATMEAVQAVEAAVVKKNMIYVIPPGKNMIIVDGRLHLFDRNGENEPFMPIDSFLRSLAEDRKENAVAVIMSGNGSDGSVGIHSIHSNLGMVVVQSLETAKYNSMPRNAIETGMADYVLPPMEMPGIILKYINALGRRGALPSQEPVGSVDAEHKILSIVKSGTGHDFSLYKRSTINRRIERRITLHQLESKEQYATYMLANPQEIHLLFEDLLIDVTSFFRNPEAFESLKQNLKKTYFASSSKKEDMRVWVTGCSTGEEVYSLGIILRELMEESGRNPRVQIFGSDITENAINIARTGEYPLAIAVDVGAKRLERYFTKLENSYKVRKEIREMVVFAPHDVIRDPPFIHLDLLSCRNLLIYFEPMLQTRVLETFSTALNPDGILFLGESETINGFEENYTALDLKRKIYRRKTYTPSASSRRISVQTHPPKEIVPQGIVPVRGHSGKEKAERILLTEHSPPCLIVNDRDEITYFHGRTNKYLEHSPGNASLALQDLLRDDIRSEVILTLNESRNSGRTVTKEAIQVHTNGDSSFLNIIVRPLEERMPVSDVLVIFDEKSIPGKILAQKQELTISPNRETRIDELERELRFTKENLRNTIEELETSNEELTSTNEELQSNNEELQSVIEESETGKEELNSLNEELLTVNTELERKNQELSTINSDTRNLLYSVDEAILFLDPLLRIRRFTPQTETIMSLLPGDIGRPIHDIAMRLDYEDLLIDSREVLDTLNTINKEVQTKDGRWYRLKIFPYRTVENVIDGVVMTFSDIDEQKKVQDKLKEVSMQAQASQEYAESIVNTIKEPLMMLDSDLVVRSANASFYKWFEATPAEVQGLPIEKILGGKWNIKPVIGRLRELSSKDVEMENMTTDIEVPRLGKKTADITARKLLSSSGRSTRMLITIHIDQ